MDSKGYSSLFALVDSHLSQTSLKNTSLNDNKNSDGVKNGSLSESVLFSPKNRFPIPSLSSNSSQITGVLTEQVANMLKAKERKHKEEKEKEDMKKLDNDEDYVIDLMKALQTSYEPPPSSLPEEPLSRTSSFESLCKMNLAEYEEEIKKKVDMPTLPCVIDMSYVIHKNKYKGLCSTFGKVLTSRVRPVAAPYLKEKIETNIKSFDFSTKSPCDIIKENLRKPLPYNPNAPSLFDIICSS
ncbi:uncharacterized protein [Battus philenor]|uniref:uncharacterized protein n=1 Tax=Battus philenor TaxID=42288 RepID=UPI0035CEA5B8